MTQSWERGPGLTGDLGSSFLAVSASLTGASWLNTAAEIPSIVPTFQQQKGERKQTTFPHFRDCRVSAMLPTVGDNVISGKPVAFISDSLLLRREWKTEVEVGSWPLSHSTISVTAFFPFPRCPPRLDSPLPAPTPSRTAQDVKYMVSFE